MNPTKRLTGVCSECGGSIQFRAELVGTMAQCPQCGKQTELMLALPPEESSAPRKGIAWMVIAVVILIAGLIASLIALKRFERLAASRNARVEAVAGTNGVAVPAGLEVSAISLEKGRGNSASYAVGTVVNTSSRRRTQISVEFDLLDSKGQRVEVARVFKPTLDAGAKWEIKVAVAADSKAVSVKLASVKEARD